MSGATSVVLAAAAVAGTAVSLINGQAQKKAAEGAAQWAQAQAQKQEKAADEAANRVNAKRANAGAALDFATQAGRAGVSGTMLTGPQGIDPAALTLGKNALLGS